MVFEANLFRTFLLKVIHQHSPEYLRKVFHPSAEGLKLAPREKQQLLLRASERLLYNGGRKECQWDFVTNF
jgi:hypothetical protein